MVSAGEKANVIADLAEASIDIRAPVSIDRRDIDSLLRMAMGASRDRVEIEPVSDYPANTSPQDNPLWEAIGDAFEQKVGTRRLLPTLMPVATDARFWRTRGAVAYGVGWLDERVSFSEFHSLFHGNDERVSIESLHRTVELLGAVIEGFGQRWRP
jgi:acetylornithine deacetylase/succinyl-diaminopimelate desuccinylase-like protein